MDVLSLGRKKSRSGLIRPLLPFFFFVMISSQSKRGKDSKAYKQINATQTPRQQEEQA